MMKKLIFIFLFLWCCVFTINAQQGEGSGRGTGVGRGIGSSDEDDSSKNNSKIKTVNILSKPRAFYTDTARNNNVQGNIRLKVEFKKNGKIGKISVVSGLPDGLNEQAIKAAEQIRFEPQSKNGKPITVTKIVNYNFTLY